MYSDVEFLHIRLPEDIEKLKWHGDFERAARVIDRRLERDIPEALKKRLRYEKEILSRIPEEYPYSWEQALSLLKERVRDFREEELEELWEEDGADWIYLNGEIRFKDDFYENLKKTRPWIAERLLDEAERDGGENGLLLNRTIRAMKEKGGAVWRFRIRSTMRIRPEAERPGERIRVYLPVPVEYAQVKNFRLLSAEIENGPERRPAGEGEYLLSAPEYPQRTVCFCAVHQAGQSYSVEYVYETHMRYVKPEPERVSDAQPRFYLEEQLPHIRFTPYLRQVTAEVVGEEANPLRKARRIYDYITSHVMYSYVRSYITITDIPEYVASGWKGDCGFQALLFITMCRIAGIPARWQSGLYAAPLSIGCHDWAQFYVAPYGWLFADCSFGGSAWRAGENERWEFYFGNLDPFRMPAVSQFQQPFDPEMRWTRNDPYDNQRGEAEYADRSLRSGEYRTEHTMVECGEIED